MGAELRAALPLGRSTATTKQEAESHAAVRDSEPKSSDRDLPAKSEGQPYWLLDGMFFGGRGGGAAARERIHK